MLKRLISLISIFEVRLIEWNTQCFLVVIRETTRESFVFVLPNGAPLSPARSLPEVMKASQQAIERGVKDCLFIDYKRRSGHFDVTTVASIKETAEKVLGSSDHRRRLSHSI